MGMRPFRRTGKILGLGVAAAAGYACGPARAEHYLSVYTGTDTTRNSDLQVRQPGAATDLTVHDVHWDAKPFKPAPYYGLRLTHFFDTHRNWGIAFDYTHYKMYAETDRSVPVTGTWQGAAVNTTAPMNRYVQHFEISHGVNIASVNAIYRWRNWQRVQPYAGAGLTHYWLHSENTVGNAYHETGYQASGFGYQVLGGVQYQATPRIGVFVEAKFDHGTARDDIAGGQAETPLRTFHALLGINYRF